MFQTRSSRRTRQGGEGLPSVPRQPQAGQILGDHRGQGRPLHPHLEGHHEEKVQADVQHHRDSQEEQGGDGVAHRPEQVGKKVIERKVATIPAKTHSR